MASDQPLGFFDMIGRYADTVNWTILAIVLAIAAMCVTLLVAITRSLGEKKDSMIKLLERDIKALEEKTREHDGGVLIKHDAIHRAEVEVLKRELENSKGLLRREKEERAEAVSRQWKAIVDNEIRKRDQAQKQLARHVADGTPAEIPAGDIAGDYFIIGRNPGRQGSGYSGKLSVGRDGDAGVFSVKWSIGGGMHVFDGVGVFSGHTLSVAWKETLLEGVLPSEPLCGVAVYEQVTGQFLRGKWACLGQGGIGMEELSRDA